MIDLSWGEILVIGAVAVIFIGPKELPGALRAAGKWIGKARLMAREFQNNVDDMIRDAELDEVKKQVTTATSFATGGIGGAIQNVVDPKGDLQKALAPPDLSLNPAPTPAPAPPPQTVAETAPPVAAPAEPAPIKPA
ncbi:MAG: Sec-independent protein translocase protein TatB [Tagaea sp.]|nr:Sec-independent protein translocase protein TatB [Tagaea sp.]